MRVIVLFLFYASFCLTTFAQSEKVLKVIGEKDLQLDNETAYPWALGSTFQYCEDTRRIAYYNRITHSVKYFDYDTGKALGQTKLFLTGPNSVGPDPYYVHYHNKDSLFVISAGNNFTLNLVSGKGEVINSYSYDEDDYTKLPFPESPRIFGSVIVNGANVYMGLQIPDRKEANTRLPIIRIDLNSGNKEYFQGGLPYKSVDVDYMPPRTQSEFYSVRIALGPNGEVIANYPMEHKLHVFHEEKEVSQVGVKHSLIGEFDFLRDRRSGYRRGAKEIKEVISVSAWYFGVIYDPYREVYYRIGKKSSNRQKVRRRINGEEVKIPYEYTISVLDKDLSLISETVLSTKEVIFHRGVFVAPDGLYVAQLNLKGEDIMGFAQLGLVSADED